MNIAFDPWIPVVTTSGERRITSLHSVFTDGEKFVDLAVRPHERVSLMRLFLCIAHAALNGPNNYDEWCDVPNRLPEVAYNYFMLWKDWFELFHPEKPWLQVAGLSQKATEPASLDDTEGWTSVSKLNFSLATGSNSTLFDHEGIALRLRNIPLSEAVVSMITFQCFSVGGLIGQVFWDGTRCGELANPKKGYGPVKSSDGPCVPASMFHAFLRGASIGKTICINLPTYEDIFFSYGTREIGKPVWEMMPTSLTDFDRIKNATETYVGRLVPMTRLIRLHPSGTQLLLGDGFSYPPFAAGFPQEPTATVVIRKNERALLSYRPSIAIWRELAAVVVKRNAKGVGGPLSLRSIQDGKGCDVIISAVARDKATIVDTIESVFHIPAPLFTSEGTATYESEVKIAEFWASRLGWAVEEYRREIDAGWEGRLKAAGPSKWTLKSKLHFAATTQYWTTVEKNLLLLMNHIESIGSDAAMPTREAWRKMIFTSAHEAYRTTCGQETPRHMRAFAKGWQKLTATKDVSETKTNTNNKMEGKS